MWFSRRRRIALAAFLGLLGTLPARSQPAGTADETGLFAYIGHPNLPHFEAVNTAALSKDFIDGAAVMFQWSEIEPRPGVYDWADVDHWVGKTLALRKKLSIGVITGLFAPDWLYAPSVGVPANSFNYNRSSVGVFCTVMKQPSFWSPAYIREYGRMLAAFADHLHRFQAPGQPPGAAWRALQVVKLSGINNTTEELRIDTTQPDDGPCHQSDATAVWAQGGYTPSKAVAAFMGLAAVTHAAFPGKLLSLAIIHKRAFPAIGEDGRVQPTQRMPDDVTQAIIDKAVATYGPHLLIQWDALNQRPPPKEVVEAGRRGAHVGWQLNGFMGTWGGSGCIYPGFHIERCHSTDDFAAILMNGMDLGGRYFEVQVVSAAASDWEPSFHAAHARLVGGR